MNEGMVIKSTGSWYHVANEKNEIFLCTIRGKIRLDKLKLTNPVTVGDKVQFIIEDEKENIGTIVKIHPRQNYVVRQSPRKKHFLHLIASNVDQAFLVVTVVKPMLKQGFIDRFLLMTEPYHIPVHIIFNKSDLYEPEDMETFYFFEEIYTTIGYFVHLTSAESDTDFESIKSLMAGKTTLIAGQSGVGKSTLVNRIQPELDLRTSDVSDKTEKGKHTTTFAQMYPLDFGGYIIDTPGIKNLSFSNLEVMDVAHNFVEFFRMSADCRFQNCTHRNEPGCAVKAAVDQNEISVYRYSTYLQILEEVEDQNYWERHQM